MITRILAAVGFAMIATFVSPAQAASSGIYFELGNGMNAGQQSVSGPVAGHEIHYYDIGSSHQSAAASAEHQTLRSHGGVQQYGSEPLGSWISSSTEAEYSKDIIVPEATFGPPGTLATLQLDLRFNGHAYTRGGFFDTDGRSLSTVVTYFSFTVVDLDDLICDEGCRPRKVVAFGFNGSVSFDSGFGTGGRTSEASYFWRVEQDGITVDDDRYEYRQYEPGAAGSGESRYSVGTGLLTLDLLSRVGHRLRFAGFLDVVASSLSIKGWSNVAGDFGETFDADLRLPGGGDIAGETLGVYAPAPVPLPGAVWLLGAAVLPLAQRLRRGV